jgi:hypothetical protein
MSNQKDIFIMLPFKGDLFAELITRKLTAAVASTFNAAKLKCLYSTSPLLRFPNKDKLPVLTNSMVIYQFKCACGATYVGRTARHLSKRIKEHCPKWLTLGGIGKIQSSVLSHLVDTGHIVNRDTAFTILYKVPPNRSKSFRFRLLATAEAIAIRLLHPVLCAQKTFVQALLLNWPSAGHVASNNGAHQIPSTT